jgi:hypothetical protein
MRARLICYAGQNHQTNSEGAGAKVSEMDSGASN